MPLTDPCRITAMIEVLHSIMTRPGIHLGDVKSAHRLEYLRDRVADLGKMGLMLPCRLGVTWHMIEEHNQRLAAGPRYDLNDVLEDIVKTCLHRR